MEEEHEEQSSTYIVRDPKRIRLLPGVEVADNGALPPAPSRMEHLWALTESELK